MDKKKLLIIIGTLLVGVFLFFYFTGTHSKKFFSWKESYRVDSKQPYGTYIFHQLMKSYFKDNFTILESSVASNLSGDQEHSLYILLGPSAYYQYQDIDSLLSFAAAGNSVFLATKTFPYDLSHEVLTGDCGVISTFPAEEITMELESTSSRYHYQYMENNEAGTYYWSFLDSLSCPEELQSIGQFDENKPNFLKVNYHDGAIYFHTTPLAFTNYYLKDEKALEYVEALMARFPADHVYWDEYSKLPFRQADQKESPLKYILTQPALKWAWYLLLALVVIYFIFYAKRRQRVIPVLPSNTNTSIEFAETMGYLYFEEQNHKKIADHKMNLFLGYIRNKYHLHTNMIDENLIQKVSLKSQVPLEEVEKIFKEYQRLDFKVEISDKDLIAFHDQIESFYHKSK